MTFLRENQLNLMLCLIGTCAVLLVLTLLTKALTAKRRNIIAFMEAGAMLLLMSDRYAYIYRGDASILGYWMVRISNFLVYFLSLGLSMGFTLYLCDLYKKEGGVKPLPKRLLACKIIIVIGIVLLVISQFTGLYYTFDSENVYHRAPGNLICFIIPTVVIVLQITVIYHYRERLNQTIRISLFLYTILLIAASIIQLFCYGISLINLTMALGIVLLYIYALRDLNHALEEARMREIKYYKEGQRKQHALFEETAEALSSAIDAKDKYTNGHSRRVANYSRRIAQEFGKTEEECEDIYFSALLHDVGKIGVPAQILNKPGKLSEEEFPLIKQHPAKGGQILSSIQQMPYLSIAARYHHERYDGKGYPDGLKGEDIPEIARIVAVADSYDAMSSFRSYRNPISQKMIREELVKGIGTQFDPKFAKIMIHFLDMDQEYAMREFGHGVNMLPPNGLRCERIYHDCIEGILVEKRKVRIRLYSQSDPGIPEKESLPTLILFDALDGRVHPDKEDNQDLLYHEYGQIRLDGHITKGGVRKVESRTSELEFDATESDHTLEHRDQYDIEAVRYRDHALVRLTHGKQRHEVILALPDRSRYFYISVTGEHCTINGIFVENEEIDVSPDYIPRIAEEISFIKDCPEGDIPNVEVDGQLTDATVGIPVRDNMKVLFHTRSLPTARLVWHCPYICLYSSEDGLIHGNDYREYIILRLDGESWDANERAENHVHISHRPSFSSWNVWKEKNKQGYDCTVDVIRDGNTINVQTENLGIVVNASITILDDTKEVYFALTGDQCAITNIHILHENWPFEAELNESGQVEHKESES